MERPRLRTRLRLRLARRRLHDGRIQPRRRLDLHPELVGREYHPGLHAEYERERAGGDGDLCGCELYGASFLLKCLGSDVDIWWVGGGIVPGRVPDWG